MPDRFAGLGPAGADQVGLVGEDDQLGAVPRAELGHRPGGVGLDGGQADVVLPGDLRVGQPRRDQADRLAFPGGQLVQPRTGRASLVRAANSAISSLVTVGESADSPAAPTRTARISSAASVVLDQGPPAPA